MKKYLFIFLSFGAFGQDDASEFKSELEVIFSPYDYALNNEKKNNAFGNLTSESYLSWDYGYKYDFGRNLLIRYSYRFKPKMSAFINLGYGVHFGEYYSRNPFASYDENGVTFGNREYLFQVKKLSYAVGINHFMISKSWFDLIFNATLGIDQNLGFRRYGTHHYSVFDVSTPDPYDSEGFLDFEDQFYSKSSTNMFFGFGIKSRFYPLSFLFCSIGAEIILGNVFQPSSASNTEQFYLPFRIDFRLQCGIGYRF